jgi:hypothetical protein
MLEGEVVTAIRKLTERGVGKKAIARQLHLNEYGAPVCAPPHRER